jgi:FAD/FMN-containing dehydrogenase
MSGAQANDEALREADLTSAIVKLRAAAAGSVVSPTDAGFDRARSVWNAMINRHPAVIVKAKGVADVIAAVTVARNHDLGISVRGGGHNVAGHAVGEGSIMIDLSDMRSVRVDPIRRRAWVEGGALWRDVDRETQAFGLATPGGVVSDTGVAGLTLSGGIGWLRSRHGLSIDNLVGADIVTADAQLLHASEQENADLLWALKGGGGNFGVVTNFEFALHPVGPEVMFCAPIYPVEMAGRVIRFWRNFLVDKNGEVGSLVEFSTVAESPEGWPKEAWGRRVVALAAVFAGDAADGERLLQPLRELGGHVADFSGRMSYCAVQQLFDTLMPAGKFRAYWKSQFLSGLPDAAIDAIVAGNVNPPSRDTYSSIWNFGGATAAVRPEATAFGDRSMGYMVSIDATWRSPEDDEANIAWTRDLWQQLQPYAQNGRIYLNFPGHGEDGETLVKSTFGPSYGRLVATKRKYDPHNRFRFNQNIRPSD